MEDHKNIIALKDSAAYRNKLRREQQEKNDGAHARMALNNKHFRRVLPEYKEKLTPKLIRAMSDRDAIDLYELARFRIFGR